MDTSVVFDQRIAAADAAGHEMHRPEIVQPAVDFLADLAGDGRALEFGIGTGRIALPLSQKGIEVAGIDVSPHMVAELRRKPGGDALEVQVADMATARVPGDFAVVFSVWNSFINLQSQDAQVACFLNAATHLRAGGHFVIETGFPGDLPPRQNSRVFMLTEDRIGVDEWNLVSQHMTSLHLWKVGDRWESWSAPCRFVWPSELDLMGRLAGLELVGRWGDWKQAPFTSDSDNHVSVWRK